MAAYSSWAPKEFDEQAVDVAESAAAQETTSQENTYQYDAASGYFYDTASGMYYDANTSLFYDSNKGAWCRYDEATKTYEPVWDGDPEPEPAPAVEAPKPKRGAVIGGAPQLNPQGVRAALEAAEEKVQQQKQSGVQGVVRGGKGKWAAKRKGAQPAAGAESDRVP